MENKETKEELFRKAKEQHGMLERRLQTLIEKPYLSPEEELEIKNIKKQKLYFKDLMASIQEEILKGDRQ